MDARGYKPALSRRGANQFMGVTSLSGLGFALRAINLSNSNSAAWPLANLAIFVPVHFVEPFLISEVGYESGATAGGNIDIGLYDEAGTRLASLGSTARTTSTVTTTTTWTDYTVTQPGLYYIAMACDGTNNIAAWAPVAGLAQSLGVMEQAAAFPLPATATFAATTQAYIPEFWLATRSLAI